MIGGTIRMDFSHYLAREKRPMEDKSEFWSDVSAVVVTPVAIAAGVVKGTYDASKIGRASCRERV